MPFLIMRVSKMGPENGARMREYFRTLHCCVVAVREQSPPSNRLLGLAVPLFLEFQHGSARSHFDFAVDDGALGDGDGTGADLAANHGGVADLQFVPDTQASGDLAGDDRLLRLDVPVPASRDGEIEAALQIAVAVHFAGNHEMPGAANIADDHAFGADESRSGRIAFEESPFLFAHGGLLPYSGPAVM